MTAWISRGPDTVVVSSTELLACWEALALGEPPTLLRLRRPGVTRTAHQDTDRLLGAALTRLAARELSDGTRPHATLARMLWILARADYHLDIRYTHPHGSGWPVLGIGAAAGAQGVVLVSTDGAGPISLCPTDSTQVAPTLLRLLGDVTAGRGTPVNIPVTALDHATHEAAEDGGVWAFADHLRTHGVSRTEAASLAHMCTGAVSGGQLGATARHPAPHGALERRGPWTIGFHRTRNGGHFMQLRRGGTLTISPTDTRRLYHQWQTLITHLPGPPT
jgi:hypothetical protein